MRVFIPDKLRRYEKIISGSLIDSLHVLRPFFRELWDRADRPVALYVRGTAARFAENLRHRPWDMDFLLFYYGDELSTQNAVKTIVLQIRNRYPSFPYPDIQIVHVVDEASAGKFLHALLLIKEGGRLLMGENMLQCLPETIPSEWCREIALYTLASATTRLSCFEVCLDASELAQRSPHLAKAVLRLGGVLHLEDGVFTRSPDECGALLFQALECVSKDVDLLIDSLAVAQNSIELVAACKRIIYLVNRFIK